MKTKILKSALSAIMAVVWIIMPVGVSATASNALGSGTPYLAQAQADIQNKEEVIYAALGAQGDVQAVYAVNHFNVNQAGMVTDYGAYSSLVNLTNTDPLASQGDTVTFHSEEGNFYYQGDLAQTDLPWLFELSYCIDGVTVVPQELAGQSGDVEIHIKSAPNESINSVFYENYMLQITVTLDTEKCANIQAPDATIASAGKNTILVYTVMPNKDADFRLTASVNDFSMAGIQISGMPLSISMELPDTENMTSDFDQLTDAISDLNNGVDDLVDGVKSLKTGASRIVSGSADINDGLGDLSQNSGQLTQASAQINSALSQMASSLENGLSGDVNLDDLAQLPQGLAQLAGGLEQISASLVELGDGFTLAYTALDAAIQAIPATTITQAQIEALYANTDPSQYGLIDQLVASYSAGQTVKGTYAQVKSAFDSVGPAITALSASIDTIAVTLNDLSTAIAQSLSGMSVLQQLGQLSSGLAELSKNYAVFHQGLTDYVDGIDQMATGYSSFHKGLDKFGRGMGDLYDGIVELHDGTAKLKDETADMPETLQSEIDDLMNGYTGSDFTPVSFASSQNTNTTLVQFVLKCDGIEQKEEETVVPNDTNNGTIWDRFIALFRM